MLQEQNSSVLLGSLWVAVGAALGSVKTFADCVVSYNNQILPSSPEIIEGCLFIASLTAVVILGLVAWKQRKKSQTLVQIIRAREATAIG